MRTATTILALAATLALAACGESKPAAESTAVAASSTESTPSTKGSAPAAKAPRIRCDIGYRPSPNRPDIQRVTVALDGWGSRARRVFRTLEIRFTRVADDPGGHFAPTVIVRVGPPSFRPDAVYYSGSLGLPDWKNQDLVNQLNDSKRLGISGGHSVFDPNSNAYLEYSCRSLDSAG
jgi:hypothetical protein